MRRTTYLVLVAGTLVAMARCSDGVGPRALENTLGVIVSAPMRVPAGAPSRGAPAAASASGTSVVYVSLSPGAVPKGATATVTNQATSQSATAVLMNGGFDPVPVVASVGDTLAIDIRSATSALLAHARLAVSPIRPLKVVRTSPPAGGRDVPLNATIVIVFSEPIDPTTVSTGTVQLLLGTTPVSGAVSLTDDLRLRATFQPTDTLAPLTTYTLVVTQAIHDLNGIALDSAAVVTFTTGSVVAPILFSTWPQSAVPGRPAFTLTVYGSGFVSGSVVNFAGTSQATTFVDSRDLTVAIPASAVATPGAAPVSVTNPTPAGGTSNTLNFGIGAPSVAIQPVRAMIILGDTTRLVATLGDSAGNVVPGLVQWRTSAPNVASVSSTGLVTGTGLGHAFVWVVSGRDSVAANVWVQPPGPAAPPNGRIAFVNYGQLYIVNVDGSGLIRVTHDSASYSRPAWSPDAARIAVVRNGQDIVVMNVDGSGAVLVASGGVSPAWSVDGARVRYAKVLPDSLVEIDEVTPDGSQTTRLCAGDFGWDYSHARDMDWSHDRTTAAFETQGRNVGPLVIELNDDHCSGARGFEGDVGGSPAWSPDGQRIAYWSSGPGFSEGTTTWQVFGILAMSPAGTGSPAFIYRDDPGYMSVYWGVKFSWSPDGKYLAFPLSAEGEEEGLQQHPTEIWITPGDGTGIPRRIGATGVQGSDPAWAPR